MNTIYISERADISDILAVAMLQLTEFDHYDVVRRNEPPEELSEDDILVGIGDLSPDKNHFGCRHTYQKCRYGGLRDGTRYTSAGLVWKKYATSIVRKLLDHDHEETAEMFDAMISQVVDKIDETLIADVDMFGELPSSIRRTTIVPPPPPREEARELRKYFGARKTNIFGTVSPTENDDD